MSPKLQTPAFSVLTPVYDTEPDHLRACVQSVLDQSLADWELVLVDDASTAPYVRPLLAELAAGDHRVRVLPRETNGGIVAASNDAFAAATGEFVALLDHDDLLTADALASLRAALDAHPDADVIYTDEDKVDADGTRYDAFYKPDWSPARLLCQMYVGHLTALRRSLVEELGGFRPDFEGSQDYDLVLRATQRARRVVHVPGVRYHWRASERSAAMSHHAKPYAYAAAIRALEDHCAGQGVVADVAQVHEAGIYRVRPRIDPEPAVSIVIPSRGSAALVDGRFRTLVTGACRSIAERSTYTNYEVVAVLDRPTPPAVVDDLRQLLGDRLKIAWYDRPFNFSDKTNVGALAADGEHLVLLNDDTEVISPDWLEALLAPTYCHDDVGLVGAKLFFADGAIQHAGHHYHGYNADHVGFLQDGHAPGPFYGFIVEREACGVTAACALVPRSVFMDVGGMTMTLPNNFNDVDLSLKIAASGRRIVWTPWAQLFHYESKTRVNTVAHWEVEGLHRRWRMAMRDDPYWHNPRDRAPDVVLHPVDRS